MMKSRKGIVLSTVAVMLLSAVLFSCTGGQPVADQGKRINGPTTEIGNGTAESYAELDAEGTLLAIGVSFGRGALEGLTTVLTDGHRCADLDGNESIERESECMPWHERILPVPTEVSRRSDMPFKWVLLNWNPRGHIPEGVWNSPHFDVHFYIDPIEDVFALMPGPCGPERMRCDQYEIATKPVPPNYIHADFRDVGAAAPAMGNHLIDPTGPEFEGEPFTRSWIFGAYDGRITFWEEMLSIEYMTSRPDDCFDIKTPADVDLSGFYPSRVCTRYRAENESVTVSLEHFEYREAALPATGE